MNLSVHLYLRRSQKKNNLCPLYLTCIVGKEVFRLPLALDWDAEYYDAERRELKPRSKPDPLHQDYTRIIMREIGKVNDIFVRYRLGDRVLTAELLKKEYYRYDLGKSFTAFWKEEMEAAYRRKKITHSTYLNHKSHLGKLVVYGGEVSFGELTPKFLESFEAQLKRNGLGVNSIWSVMKTFRSYIRQALDEGKVFASPLGKHKLKHEDTRPEHLTVEELHAIERYYHACENLDEQHVLRPFLFGCQTGLRVSDLLLITVANVNDGVLRFTPKKTERFGKQVEVPLTRKALSYITVKKGKIFTMMTEPAARRVLKRIAAACGISKDISFHTARHTFAVLFLEAGGSVEVLKELLGHSKIEVTMIYVHVTDERKRKQIALLEAYA